MAPWFNARCRYRLGPEMMWAGIGKRLRIVLELRSKHGPTFDVGQMNVELDGVTAQASRQRQAYVPTQCAPGVRVHAVRSQIEKNPVKTGVVLDDEEDPVAGLFLGSIVVHFVLHEEDG